MKKEIKENPTSVQSRTKQIKKNFTNIFACLCILFAISTGCKKSKSDDTTPVTTTPTGYQQVRLVSDTAGYGAGRIDANLSNAWGIAIGPTGSFWISSNHKGLTTIYDRNGVQLLAPVAIPSQGIHFGGAPTGAVYNSTPDFMGSKFIYDGEDGIISTWTSGDSTITAADMSASGAIYKGLALANDGGANFLYATDFHNNKIDVFDANFNLVTKPFVDPTIPAGFAPFNIQSVGSVLYVTYAMQKGPDNEDDQAGPGNGYVDIYNTNGTLVKRFASQGTLNSPWGVAVAPTGFGLGSNAVLIGNFGDGHINVYDSSGTYKSQLSDNGTTMKIDGLWALAFPQNNIPAGDQNQLFFTAGPLEESHGLFGYIKKR